MHVRIAHVRTSMNMHAIYKSFFYPHQNLLIGIEDIFWGSKKEGPVRSSFGPRIYNQKVLLLKKQTQ